MGAARDVRLRALAISVRGPRLLGIDNKQLAWILLHSVLFSLLCYWDTQFTISLKGALDWQHFSWYDTLYMAGAVGSIAVTGLLYRSLYASDPGWVRPGSHFEAPDRPACQYCGVRPPLRSRHCFITGQCVVKYDHLCDLLSTPIGELNHLRFWVFLLMQTWTVLWGVIVAANAVGGCLWPSVARLEGHCWMLSPFRTIALLVILLALLALFSLFGSLWLLHIYFVCTAQTTYEVLKGIGVPYLSLFYATYNGPHSRQLRYSTVWPEIVRRLMIGNPPPAPFSEGLAKNLETFFFAPKPHVYKYHALI